MDAVRDGVTQAMNLLWEATWDRFVGDELHGSVYGWIVREDQFYRDFVVLEWWHDPPELMIGFTTSSARHSALFAERLGIEEHLECQRVEHHFPDAERVVRLAV